MGLDDHLTALQIADINNFARLPDDQRAAFLKHAEEATQATLTADQVPLVFASLHFTCCRSLPPPQNPIGVEFDPEEDEPVPMAGWPVLSCLYGLTLRSLELFAAECKPLVTMELVLQLMVLLDSEDPREREAIKTIVHKAYGQYLQLRAPMRKAMQAVLLETVHCNAPHKLAELLEIFGSIVNGFAVPLRREHVQVFLKRCLLPLHTVTNTLTTFFPQLAYCVVQFAEKDASLGVLIVTYLLQHWPKHNSLLQVLFLGEVEECMDHMDAQHLLQIKQPLFKKLAECIRSSHFQVAERALMLWSHELVAQSSPDMRTMGVMVQALTEAQRQHWNKNVQAMALAALSTMSEMDPVMYASACQKLHDSDSDSHDIVMSNTPDDTNTSGTIND